MKKTLSTHIIPVLFDCSDLKTSSFQSIPQSRPTRHFLACSMHHSPLRHQQPPDTPAQWEPAVASDRVYVISKQCSRLELVGAATASRRFGGETRAVIAVSADESHYWELERQIAVRTLVALVETGVVHNRGNFPLQSLVGRHDISDALSVLRVIFSPRLYCLHCAIQSVDMTDNELLNHS